MKKTKSAPRSIANENIYQTADRLKIEYPELKDFLTNVTRRLRIVEQNAYSNRYTKEEQLQFRQEEEELYEKIEEINRRKFLERFKQKFENEKKLAIDS
jgi:PHD/YefM family antitoxin component YafN of YafNO toxin-antitoxin module